MNYIVDYYGDLRIYDDNKLIAVVSNCGGLTDEQIQELIKQTQIIYTKNSEDHNTGPKEWTQEDLDNLKEYLSR